MHQFTRKTTILAASFMATTLWVATGLQPVSAQSAVRNPNANTAPESALIPFCSTDNTGDGDGLPKQRGSTDGLPKQRGSTDGLPKQRGSTDGSGGMSLYTLRPSALTTPGQPDLAISLANGSLESSHYSLSFCVINRGGKPAFSPIAVAVLAGDVVLQELTIFQPIPSLRAACFGSGDREPLLAAAKTNGATIQVTAATGETALLNNKCRIQWGK